MVVIEQSFSPCGSDLPKTSAPIASARRRRLRDNQRVIVPSDFADIDRRQDGFPFQRAAWPRQRDAFGCRIQNKEQVQRLLTVPVSGALNAPGTDLPVDGSGNVVGQDRVGYG